MYTVTVYLNAGGAITLTVEENFHAWLEEVKRYGIESNDLFVPLSSVSYVKFESVTEQNNEQVEEMAR